MNTTTKKTNFYTQLQGLRCIACLLVIADHSNLMGMAGHGGVAVSFFLALSGFLLVRPWQPDGEAAFLTLSGIGNFYKRKVLRLLPAYYVLVIVHTLLSGYYDSLPGNLLFFNCSGHLWYVQQYLVMLLLFPLLMILICLLKQKLKMNNFMIAVLLLVLAYICRRYITVSLFYLMGNNKKQRFRVGLLLVGMCAGYLRKGKPLMIQNRIASVFADLPCIVIIAASVLTSSRFVGSFFPFLTGVSVAWGKDFECALFSAVLILLLTANPEGILSRFLKNPIMLLIGTLSYYIYLVHPLLMDYVNAPTASRLFVRILLLSICISYSLNVLLDKHLLYKIFRNFRAS